MIKENRTKTTQIDNIDVIDIDVNNFKFSDKVILKNIKIKASKGDTFLIKGTNGSGKTTLLKIITNIYNDFDGYININGININDITNLYDKILYISQNDCFIETTLKSYLLELSKNDISDNQISNLLDKLNLDLSLDTKIDLSGNNLSGGQKKKLQLLRLLLSYDSYDFIILDEVDAGLDQKSLVIYNQIIDKIIESNKILFIVTHSNCLEIKPDKIIDLD